MLKLYYFDISAMSDEQFLEMYHRCDKSRKLKIDRLKKDPAKKLSVAAGMLARCGIARQFNVAPESISFRAGKNGKPYCDNYDIHFSLSHSENMAVCVISDKPVGIDVEKIRPVNPEVAKKCFTEKEQEYVFSDKSKTRARFFEIWTKKEAYIKRNALSLSDIKSFDVLDDKSVYLANEKEYVVAVAITE